MKAKGERIVKFVDGQMRDFMIYELVDKYDPILKEKAKEIVEEHNKIIASKRDQEIFFNELIKPSNPNEALTNAAIRYKNIINSL